MDPWTIFLLGVALIMVWVFRGPIVLFMLATFGAACAGFGVAMWFLFKMLESAASWLKRLKNGK